MHFLCCKIARNLSLSLSLSLFRFKKEQNKYLKFSRDCGFFNISYIEQHENLSSYSFNITTETTAKVLSDIKQAGAAAAATLALMAPERNETCGEMKERIVLGEKKYETLLGSFLS